MEKLSEEIDKCYDEKNKIITRYREEQKVVDSYLKLKRNIEWVRRVQQALKREEEEKEEKVKEEKTRKANQMSEWEVNKA